MDQHPMQDELRGKNVRMTAAMFAALSARAFERSGKPPNPNAYSGFTCPNCLGLAFRAVYLLESKTLLLTCAGCGQGIVGVAVADGEPPTPVTPERSE